MSIDDREAAPQAPVQTTLSAIFFSMELSRSAIRMMRQGQKIASARRLFHPARPMMRWS